MYYEDMTTNSTRQIDILTVTVCFFLVVLLGMKCDCLSDSFFCRTFKNCSNVRLPAPWLFDVAPLLFEAVNSSVSTINPPTAPSSTVDAEASHFHMQPEVVSMQPLPHNVLGSYCK